MKEINKLVLVKIENLVRDERRITREILDCLAEVEQRMIYAELGYSSLYEFCVKHLKYSEGSAHRRISAMRLLKGLPEVVRQETKAKIEAGSLSVTNLSVAHSFFKLERAENKTYSPEEKISLLNAMENQSKRDVEKQLAAIQPKIITQESKRVITESLTEIRFLADEVLLKKLERVREISAHALPDSGMAQLLNRLADEYLKKHDPLVKAGKTLGGVADVSSTSLTTKPCVKETVAHQDKNTRYIPAAIRVEVWKKSEGKCTFKQCGSKYGLEIEHVFPFALGGTHALENLTLRCRAHNQLAARRVFGESKYS